MGTIQWFCWGLVGVVRKRRSGPVKNLTGITCFVLLSVGFGSISWSQTPWKSQAKELSNAIRSKDEIARSQAKQGFLRQRHDSVEELIRIVDGPLSQGEEFFNSSTPRNTAIFLLGELRAAEAVPSLMKWISPREGQSMVIDELSLLPPAAAALARIGMPSVNPLLERMKLKGAELKGFEPEGRVCLMTMVRILKSDLAEAKLEKTLAGEENEEYRKNLQAALDALRNTDIPVEKLEGSQ